METNRSASVSVRSLDIVAIVGGLISSGVAAIYDLFERWKSGRTGDQTCLFWVVVTAVAIALAFWWKV